MIDHWIPGRKARERKDFLRDLTPVVLMGRGHSGTRVLAFACMHLGIKLGASEELATGDADDRDFTDRVKKLTLSNVDVTSSRCVRRSDLRYFQKAVYEYYIRLGSPSGLWGWKFPETYIIGACLAHTFPRAKYLHLVRDGRDIAFKEHLTDNPRRKIGKKILSRTGALSLPRYLQAASSWAYQVDAFDQFRKTIPPDQVLDVTFERLCLNPAETIDRVCKFLQIEINEACRTYLSDGINRSKVAQYRENPPDQISQVEEHGGATLKRYGYVQ